MLTTARLYPAAEAHTVGLVNQVLPDELLLRKVYAVAEQIAGYPADLLAGYKQNVYAAEAEGMSAAVAIERENQLAAFDHPDFLVRLANFTSGRG